MSLCLTKISTEYGIALCGSMVRNGDVVDVAVEVGMKTPTFTTTLFSFRFCNFGNAKQRIYRPPQVQLEAVKVLYLI